jgi:hypothetical protein
VLPLVVAAGARILRNHYGGFGRDRKATSISVVGTNGRTESREAMTTAEVREGSELERIETWRRERLEAAGYPPAAAAELALRHDVDLHRAVGLLERGCPVDVALRILR